MTSPMTLRRRAVLAASLALLISPALAAPPGPIAVSGAWTRPAAAGINGAGYLIIVNHGRLADTLIGVTSPAAARGSIHQSAMAANGVMTMRQLPSLAIAPGATVRFAPGGYHLMLEGLKRPLKVGETVPAVLTFAKAGRAPVTFTVRNSAPDLSMPGMVM